MLSNPLDFELDEDLDQLQHAANDELWECSLDVFFFGKLINDDVDELVRNADNAAAPIDENAYYCLCPECNMLFKVTDPETGAGIVCEHCSRDGTLYDYRDKTLDMLSTYCQPLAHLSPFEKGCVLRLYDVGLDYSERAYDDYTMLHCEPTARFREVAREYWCEGVTRTYVNKAPEDDIEPEFSEIKAKDWSDGDYYIVNWDDGNSALIYDILYDKNDKKTGENFIEYFSKKFSYRTFSTLQKYGFTHLSEAYFR